MKRFILGVCAVIAAAVLAFSVCGSRSEQTADLFTDNVEALTDREVIITVGPLCALTSGSFCIWTYDYGDHWEFDIVQGVWA